MTKQLTEREFIALLAHATIKSDSETLDDYEVPETIFTNDPDEPFAEIQKPFRQKFIWNELTIDHEGLKLEVTYQEHLSWPTYDPDKYCADAEGNNTWNIGVQNFVVFDEDDEVLKEYQFLNLIYENTNITHLNYDNYIDQPEDIDLDEDSDMTDQEKITVQRDNKPDFRFTGELIGSATSSPNTAHPSYSGSTGRWTELELYKTVSGKFVATQVGRTQWQGEQDRYSAMVCETEADVIEYLGHGWLAKELYEATGIEDIEEIN